MDDKIACMCVGDVNLDDRTGQNGKRVANAIAVVRPGPRVDQHAVNLVGEALVDPQA